ncbi:MAG: hypothetical protein JWL92_142 [Candidatus Nomurabacteria bacterium]|nr:hypothetical protein [Candidatus Nomurabacteria bacterium]
MKKLVIFVLSILLTITSCKKEDVVIDPVSTAPYLTIISPEGGQTFFAGQYITVKWKSGNLPPGHLIGAMIINNQFEISSKVAISMYPQKRVPTSVSVLTNDDGEEVFRIPADEGDVGNFLYENGTSHGKSFTICLTYSDPSNPKDVGINSTALSESKMFTVTKAPLYPGCTSTVGVSTIDKHPCSTPVN